MKTEEKKDLDYWKKNAEEDYMQVPISVLRYISELEKVVQNCSTATSDLLEAAKIGLECLKEIGEFQDGWSEDLEKVEKAIEKALK